MPSSRASQRRIAFFLLIMLGGNFFLSVFWPYWHGFLPWHEHIVLGPIYPGWEDHHRELGRQRGYLHSHLQLAALPVGEPAISSQANTGGSTHVISVYRSPVGDGTIFSCAIQLLWLAEWPTLPEPSSLVWFVGLPSLSLSSALLPPPDEPPRPLF
jgi:hypothetical protein